MGKTYTILGISNGDILVYPTNMIWVCLKMGYTPKLSSFNRTINHLISRYFIFIQTHTYIYIYIYIHDYRYLCAWISYDMRYSTARKKLIHMLPPFLFELWQDRAAIGTLEIDGDQQLQGFLDGEWRYTRWGRPQIHT